MSIIGSFANYGTSSTLYRTRTDLLDTKSSSDAMLTSSTDKENKTTQVQPTLKVDSSDNQRTYEEALARMLVNLNSLNSRAEGTGSETEDANLASGQSSSSDDALTQFMAYMQMTPGEKMRDKVLREIGMSEDDLQALDPEQREQVEKEIAEKLQTLQELQASQRDEPDNLHAQA